MQVKRLFVSLASAIAGVWLMAGSLEAKDEPRKGDTGDEVKRGAGQLGEKMSQAWITTKIKAQFFEDDKVKASDIDVDTDKNGVVTLNGTVASEAARARAVEIVHGTEGVRAVKDQLKVKPSRDKD